MHHMCRPYYKLAGCNTSITRDYFVRNEDIHDGYHIVREQREKLRLLSDRNLLPKVGLYIQISQFRYQIVKGIK